MILNQNKMRLRTLILVAVVFIVYVLVMNSVVKFLEGFLVAYDENSVTIKTDKDELKIQKNKMNVYRKLLEHILNLWVFPILMLWI